MRIPGLLLCAVLAPTIAAVSRPAAAQQASAAAHGAAASDCAYAACALGIVPRWNGLAVVRGDGGPQVANLNFFWPRDITSALRGTSVPTPGAERMVAHARQAVRLRRIGAALTDAGILAGAAGALGALRAGRVRRSDGVLLGVGGAALGLSAPFQFAADGALSRAVWWHNARFAR